MKNFQARISLGTPGSVFFSTPFLLIFIAATLSAGALCAQAPTLSYSGPKAYTAGTPIASLAPTSSGVAAPAYSSTATQVGSGFQNPGGTSVDAAGNVYVAVYADNEVLKVPAGGGTPVVIGSGFYEPNDVKVDAAGDVFVADQGHSLIKEVPAGSSSTITLGSGFSYPAAIALDNAGYIYIADPGNGAVKKMPVTGGTPVTIGYFNNPFGVGVDGQGNVYVTDANFNLYEIPAAGGAPITLASGFNNPNLIGVDASGNVFISDSNNSLVKMYPAGGGSLVTIPASFGFPFAVSVDAAENIYVSDENNSEVTKVAAVGGYYIQPALPHGLLFNTNTGVISGTPTVASPAITYTITAFNASGHTPATLSIKVNLPAVPALSYTTPPAYTVGTAITSLTPASANVSAPTYSTVPVTIGSGFGGPEGTAVDPAGNIYVADPNNNEVKMIPAGGGTPVVVGSGFNLPTDVALDGAGNLYVADYLNNAIKEIKAGTNTPISIGAGFLHPFGVATDALGNVYVGDQGHNMVKEIPAGGGAPIILASGLSYPDGLCVDGQGNVYFADLGNSAIKKIPVGGGAPVIVGTGFTQPASVAVDALGNLFVADRNNNAIKEVLAGTNTTIAIGTNINFPNGVSVDADGNVWVGDYGNNAVKEIKPTGGYYMSPSLPAGLTYNNKTGVISGTPTLASPATTYAAADFNLAGSAKTTLSLSVVAPGSIMLSGLTISSGTPDPVFSAGKLTYEVSVANTVTSLTITPTASVATSTIKVNGTSVTSGTASQAISLLAGRNTISIIVTAQGGNPSQTYEITVFRAESTVTTLSALTPSAGTLSPAFTSSAVSYSDLVSSGTTSITVTPVTSTSVSTVAVNGTAVNSGSASAAIALNTGSNTVTVVVTAQDGFTTKTYTINFIRSSTNAQLSALSISSGTLTPAFAAATTSYTASVTASSITLTPTAAVAGSTIKVNGTTVASGAASGTIALNIGSNAITTVVTAQDAVTTDTYTINITRSTSSVVSLSALTLSSGTLSPAFDGGATSYTATVANSVASLTVTPTATDPSAKVTVNGISVISGTASGPIALNVGSNTITTIVTAQDGVTKKTYTVTVIRESGNDNLSALTLSSGSLSPAFASGTKTYTATVANNVASVTITPTTSDPSATGVTVNGITVTSGTASGPVALNVGTNTITVIVTAHDPSFTKTYTVTITRESGNDNLSALTISSVTLSPVFASTVKTYTASVGYGVSSVMVTPTTTDPSATGVTVNGKAVKSGTASGPVVLNAGQNTITIIVTAHDPSFTKTYTVTVTRAPSTNAVLSGLSISAGSLSPTFASGTTSYTATVANSVASLTVTPATSNPGATATVNGMAVMSGSASGPLTLNVGSNTITTIVTAQDGLTKKTYTITVTRESGNDNLSALKLSSGSLSPAFASGTKTYTASVANSVSSVTVTPTTSDQSATGVTVNGTAVKSGTASGVVALSAGPNTITIIVTAHDPSFVKTYTITVTRASGSDNTVYQPVSVETPADSPQLADDGIIVHRGVSPNGDGIDDFLQIDNITSYPDNRLTIMNRNGILVYEVKGYDNISKIFDGHSNKTGQMQLPGTYFYSLDYTVKGITKHKTGFLVLKY